MPLPATPLVSLGRLVGNLRPRPAVHDETVMSMVVGHAGNVGIVKMGTVPKAVEDAHIPVTVFLARLTQFGLENEILDFDSSKQGDVVGRTDLVLVLALGKVLMNPTPFSVPHFQTRLSVAMKSPMDWSFLKSCR